MEPSVWASGTKRPPSDIERKTPLPDRDADPSPWDRRTPMQEKDYRPVPAVPIDPKPKSKD